MTEVETEALDAIVPEFDTDVVGVGERECEILFQFEMVALVVLDRAWGDTDTDCVGVCDRACVSVHVWVGVIVRFMVMDAVCALETVTVGDTLPLVTSLVSVTVSVIVLLRVGDFLGVCVSDSVLVTCFVLDFLVHEGETCWEMVYVCVLPIVCERPVGVLENVIVSVTVLERDF